MTEAKEMKIRYLEMLQQIINRMATNSFAIKGWAVTLVAGILVLANKDSRLEFFIIVYFPVIIFWGLDSYYLQLERRYRAQYNTVAKANDVIDFEVKLPAPNIKDTTSYFQCVLSVSEIVFYLSIILIVAITVIVSPI